MDPYFVTDAAQNYLEFPTSNGSQLLLADSRISKDIQVNPNTAVRLSVAVVQLSTFNPEALHSNAADPGVWFLLRHRGRRFTADFDVCFRVSWQRRRSVLPPVICHSATTRATSGSAGPPPIPPGTPGKPVRLGFA